jgi:hypothetical protein
MTDNPSCGFEEVNVTVSKVRIHQSSDVNNDNDAGWVDITLPAPEKINLASLVNGVLVDLGQTPLSAGHYTQLRLVLDAGDPLNNSVVPTGGVETPMDTPSGAQSGLKLIHSFDVAEDELVDLVLDFDACRSVVMKGNGGYALKPVIRVIPMDVSGSIEGILDDSLDGFNPLVHAEQDGRVLKSTFPDEEGQFILSPLQAGNYDVVITADNHAAAMIRTVPVTAGETILVSRDTSPIDLADSAMGTVSGTVDPAAAEASVRAFQTFPSDGPVMEVAFTPANLDTGDYTLSLPVDAPFLGTYEGTLPVVFDEYPAIAGQYGVEASAEGYNVQSADVDISGGDVDQDFTLEAN